MIIRDFNPIDAEACLQMRYDAIDIIFRGKISPEGVDAHLREYKPSDLVRISEEGKSFVADDDGSLVGFCTIYKKTPYAVDLPFVYIKLDRLKEGVGTALMNHMEKWIPGNWPEVVCVEVKTVIPEYNGRFYKQLGYKEAGPCEIVFKDGTVPAVKYVKNITTEKGLG